jgi:hypothetical protein
MLRHIISVSLAMTACATLISTKANAISLTLTPLGSLERNAGDRIAFILKFDPQKGGLFGVKIQKIYQPTVSNPEEGIYDSNELSFAEFIPLIDIANEPVTRSRDIAVLIFNVINPIKDEKGDVSARVDYRIGPVDNSVFAGNSTFQDVQPVPEPLTIFGTAIGLGCGVLFKRKSSKKTVS